MSLRTAIPVLGFAAYSGTGKTTLLIRLLPLLRERGLRIGMVKHAHHTFEIDYPGKDSYELRHAGASQILVGSRKRWALVVETPDDGNENLQTYIDRLDQNSLDLILVEGFKPEAIPKIELHRPALGKPLMCRDDGSIIALAHDAPEPLPVAVPQLDINNPPAIVAFVVDRFLGAAENRVDAG